MFVPNLRSASSAASSAFWRSFSRLAASALNLSRYVLELPAASPDSAARDFVGVASPLSSPSVALSPAAPPGCSVVLIESPRARLASCSWRLLNPLAASWPSSATSLEASW